MYVYLNINNINNEYMFEYNYYMHNINIAIEFGRTTIRLNAVQPHVMMSQICQHLNELNY